VTNSDLTPSQMKIKNVLPLRILFIGITVLLSPIGICTQGQNIFSNLEGHVELSGTQTSGDYAPLWLSANRYGLSSVNSSSAYERIQLFRHFQSDSTRTLQLGYGLDVALLQNAVSSFQVNQAYIEAVFQKIHITVGSRQHPIDLRNQELTSGGLSMGINAIPIPQVRINVDYFDLFGTHGWWTWKGRLAYGFLTDDSYVNRYQSGNSRYAKGTLYHEKALYWKFGRLDKIPLKFEIGLQMAAEWGGTTYNASGRNHETKSTLHHDVNLRTAWNAFIAGGADETDGVDQNTQGNHLGSYNMALTYQCPSATWGVRAYFERFFEDQSNLTLQYGIRDHLLGLECILPQSWPVSNIVVEHLYTRNQSGAVYHDRTSTLPEKMNGRDNYYNHNLYNGWQHWGQTLGHPFLTSPVYTHTQAYDTNGYLFFHNNRVEGWHFGISGSPFSNFHYRLLLSLTQNWGTYDAPFEDIYRQNYFLMEISYAPSSLPKWKGTLDLGIDHGHLLGNSTGVQLTISRSLRL